MSSLFDKLNILVKARLNNLVDPRGTPRGSAPRSGKDADKDIAALRQNINQALAQEDSIKERIGQIQRQIEDFDRQADAALQNDDEASARGFLQQMKRQEQLAAMLNAELDDHRRATSDLIERVNMLDAAVSDARREADASSATSGTAAAPPADQAAHHIPITIQGESAPQSAAPNATQGATQSTAQNATAPSASPPPVKIQVSGTSDSPTIKSDNKSDSTSDDDADIARRRARLSKPD